MAEQHRIRVRAQQHPEIDSHLLTQALLLIADDMTRLESDAITDDCGLIGCHCQDRPRTGPAESQP